MESFLKVPKLRLLFLCASLSSLQWEILIQLTCGEGKVLGHLKMSSGVSYKQLWLRVIDMPYHPIRWAYSGKHSVTVQTSPWAGPLGGNSLSCFLFLQKMQEDFYDSSSWKGSILSALSSPSRALGHPSISRPVTWRWFSLCSAQVGRPCQMPPGCSLSPLPASAQAGPQGLAHSLQKPSGPGVSPLSHWMSSFWACPSLCSPTGHRLCLWGRVYPLVLKSEVDFVTVTCRMTFIDEEPRIIWWSREVSTPGM